LDNVLKQILDELKSLRLGQEAQGQRLERLEQGQEALIRRVGNLEQGQEALISRVGNLEQGQEALISRVGNLEQGQRRLELRLEHEVVEKVKVLFDAHSLHLDYFESIRDSQARMEELLNMTFDQVVELDDKQKSQERELRLLRARKSRP
jgi:hypothetical protein